MSNKIDSYIMKASVTKEDFNSINDIDVTDIYLDWKNPNNWGLFDTTELINYKDTVLIKRKVGLPNRAPQRPPFIDTNKIGYVYKIYVRKDSINNVVPAPDVDGINYNDTDTKNNIYYDIYKSTTIFNTVDDIKIYVDNFITNTFNYIIKVYTHFYVYVYEYNYNENSYNYNISDSYIIFIDKDKKRKICNTYFTNIGYLKITNLPKGKYNLSFLRTNGYDGTDSVKIKKYYDKQYCWFNLYKYNSSQESQFDEVIKNSSIAYTNDTVNNIYDRELKLFNTNITDNLLYNVSTPFYLSKYDIQQFIEYYVNINNDESVYQYMKNFSDNFRTSIQFTSSDESDIFILLFYYPYNDIQLTGQKQFDNYNIYLSNFKLEYNIKDSN